MLYYFPTEDSKILINPAVKNIVSFKFCLNLFFPKLYDLEAFSHTCEICQKFILQTYNVWISNFKSVFKFLGIFEFRKTLYSQLKQRLLQIHQA